MGHLWGIHVLAFGNILGVLEGACDCLCGAGICEGATGCLGVPSISVWPCVSTQ